MLLKATGMWGREACVKRSEQQLTCVRVMLCGHGSGVRRVCEIKQNGVYSTLVRRIEAQWCRGRTSPSWKKICGTGGLYQRVR